MRFVLATRGSPLALWQANEARRLVLARRPELVVELHVVKSAGDLDSRTALAKFGLTGIFTAEVDHAVLSGAAHAGVHSLKDMPTTLHDELALAGCLARGPVEDVLVSRAGLSLARLPLGARVATGSVRRAALLRSTRQDLVVAEIRGNVDTRIDKLLAGDADALVVARAGLVRLGLQHHIAEILDAARFVPAVGQGIVGLTCRRADRHATEVIHAIGDVASFSQAQAERALLHGLHGGCNAPVGAHAIVGGDRIDLHARVLSLDGRESLEDRAAGRRSEAVELGRALAERLVERGAKRLIDAARST